MKYARDRTRHCRSVARSGPSDDVARHAANDEERLEIAERWLARLQRMPRGSREQTWNASCYWKVRIRLYDPVLVREQ